MKPERELATYIAARYPLISVVSTEYRRVQAAINAWALKKEREVRIWSCYSGFRGPDGSSPEDVLDPLAALRTIAEDSRPAVYVLHNFHPFLDATNPINVPQIQGLLELADVLKTLPKDRPKTIILLGPRLEIPPELQDEIAVISWPLPDGEDLKRSLDSVIGALPPKMKESLPEDLGPIVDAARGLSQDGASNCYARSFVLARTLDPAVISQEKKQVVAREGILDWIDATVALDDIGGLEVLKQWLTERKAAFSTAAKEYGLPEPKGLLNVGVAGCGKSLTAKAIASAWALPLLRLDVGSLFGALLGESEEKQRKALGVAEAVSPCILWLDELEKAFAGLASGAATDGGVSARIFGNILTWMQEKTKPVFVVATSNNVEALPPELLRKGRFDDVFFVDLPTATEREAIWRIHILKRERKPADYNIEALVKKSSGMSGAEIEAALIDGMFRAFSSGGEVADVHIQSALADTVPLSKTASDKIEALRSWAKGRARMASLPEEATNGEAERFASLEVN